MGLRLLAEDLRHHAETTVALAVIVAAAAALTTFSWSVSSGAARAFTVGTERLGADLVVVKAGEGGDVRAALVTGKPLTAYFAEPTEQIRGVEGVEAATPQLFLSSANAWCCDEGDVLIVGIDPESDFVITPWVLRGELPVSDRIVTGAAVKRPVGLPLTFYGQRRIVAANLARTGWGYFDRAAFVSLAEVRKTARESLTRDKVVDVDVPEGSVSLVFVRATDAARAAERIRAAVPGVDVVEIGGLGAGLRATGTAATRAAAVAVVLAALVAAALVAAVVAGSVFRRRRDLALLRALGMSAPALARTVVAEVALVAAPAALAGASAGWASAALFAGWFTYRAQLPLLVPAVAAGGAMLATVTAGATLLAAATALVPAWRAAKCDPYVGLNA